MTEQFGPCGIGWKYEIVRLWNEPAPEGQIFAFALVNVYIKDGDTWSEPIPGSGGSMLVEKETKGLHTSDEGYKMALTDALSVAMKMIGVAGDIYASKWDGAKYTEPPQEAPESKKSATKPSDGTTTQPTKQQVDTRGMSDPKNIKKLGDLHNALYKDFKMMPDAALKELNLHDWSELGTTPEKLAEAYIAVATPRLYPENK
jgi:hypothetical protein